MFSLRQGKMLEEISKDSCYSSHASNQSLFRTDIDYDKLLLKREDIVNKWKSLSSEEKSVYKNQIDFENQNGSVDLKDESLIPARNVSLMMREVQERINTSNLLKLLPLETLDFDDSVLELAESLENIEDIRDLYKLRKRIIGTTKNAGISASEAAKLKNCFSQGRELYLAGKQGSLMVKPLNFFYALTAYSYGGIVLNNPLRFRKDMIPGSHGMSYLPDQVQAQFGGDSARGTFSDLVTSYPTHLVKDKNIEFNIDCSESVINFYEIKHSVSLGTLLSMVPEMTDYYKLTTGNNSRCFPLEISSANDPRSLVWEFHIGNGETRPSISSIESAFKGFPHAERHGKIVVTVPASKSSSIKACIYSDLRGSLWFIENPFFPIVLPEIALHFLITSMFSNIMRYRPDEWGNVLLNDVSSSISLLTRHYFSSFQRKFFIVILRSLSRYIPYVA